MKEQIEGSGLSNTDQNNPNPLTRHSHSGPILPVWKTRTTNPTDIQSKTLDACSR